MNWITLFSKDCLSLEAIDGAVEEFMEIELEPSELGLGSIIAQLILSSDYMGWSPDNLRELCVRSSADGEYPHISFTDDARAAVWEVLTGS